MRLRLCCNGCIRGRIPDVINSRVYKSAMQKRCINEETTSLTGTIIACLRHWNFSVYISIHGILAIKDKDKQMFKFIAKQKKTKTNQCIYNKLFIWIADTQSFEQHLLFFIQNWVNVKNDEFCAYSSVCTKHL